MGVNLVPLIDGYTIKFRTFRDTSCAVAEECAQTGRRKLLCFNFRVWNKGNRDLHLGDPAEQKRLFYYSPCHRHHHLKEFNSYMLFGARGIRPRRSQKQGFCMEDTAWKGPGARRARQFDCHDQGITAGWYDLYDRDLPCQWIDVTDLPDGDYVLRAETNPRRRNGRRLVREDSYSDNVAYAGVRITAKRATRLSRLPFRPPK